LPDGPDIPLMMALIPAFSAPALVHSTVRILVLFNFGNNKMYDFSLVGNDGSRLFYYAAGTSNCAALAASKVSKLAPNLFTPSFIPAYAPASPF